jgi:hypothetical protein
MKRISIKNINDVVVKPFKVNPDIPINKIQGGNLFPLRRNIAIIARKNSGKTCLIGNILLNCANKMSTVFIICSTVELDKTYQVIIKKLEKKGVTVITHQSLYDYDDKNLTGVSINNLDTIMDLMKDAKIEENEPKEEPKEENAGFMQLKKKPKQLISTQDDDVKKERKPRPPKLIANKFFVVLDDLSNELHDQSVEKFVKKNRHYDCSVIISNQAFTDLSPATRKQFDDVLLLGGHKKDKLSIIYKDIDPPFSLDTFIDLYEHATSKKYEFFNINREGVAKKNFNCQFKEI